MSDVELQLLEVLLDAGFPGSMELRQQAAAALVTRIDANGSPALRFRVPDEAPRAFVRGRVPVEGCTSEADGSAIHCLLHVVRGRLAELEFFRENGEPIQDLPDPRTMRVIVNSAEDSPDGSSSPA